MFAARCRAVVVLCLALAVETPTAARRRQLAALITEAFEASRQVHGCRRIVRDLNNAGHDVSVGTVAAIMRQLGLKAVQPRAYKRTTVAGEAPVPAPDLIGRDFATGRTPGTRPSATSPTSRPTKAGSTSRP